MNLNFKTTAMQQQIIGISEFQVSADVDDLLTTFSLGSCLGVTLYDPQEKIGGMAHCLLPLSKADTDKAKEKPAMFADTGVVALLEAVLALGAKKSRLIVKAAGCASPMDKNGRFKIGDRNLAVLRKVLWKNNMLMTADDTGGTHPRTMRLNIATGETTVSTGKQVTTL